MKKLIIAAIICVLSLFLPVMQTANAEQTGPDCKFHRRMNSGESDASHLWAVILSCSSGQSDNHPRFWNDCAFMYATLTREYGYRDDHVFTLMSDGIDPAPDLSSGISSPLDLNGDDIPDIDYSCTEANVSAVFSGLADQLGADDSLFIFVTGQGDHGSGQDAEIKLWNSDVLRDDAFADLLEEIQCARFIITMGQSYSGGFIDDVSSMNSSVDLIMTTACAWNETAHSMSPDDLYDEYLHHWMSAVAGEQPDGAAVNADADSDGMVSFYEAFQYAQAHDAASETPQFYESGSGLGARAGLDRCIHGSVSIGDASGCHGDTVPFPVLIDSIDKSIHSFTLDIEYDANKLHFDTCASGDLTGGWTMLDCDVVGSGRLRIAGFTAATPIPSGSNGSIAMLRFQVFCPQCVTGQAYPLEIVDAQDDLVNFARHNGVFTIDCPPTPDPSQTPSIRDVVSISDASGCHGEMIYIPVTVTTMDTAVDAITLDIEYDRNKLHFDTCAPGDLTGGWTMLDCDVMVSGRLRIAGFTAATPIPVGSNGSIAMLRFQVFCPQCVTGQAYPLEIVAAQDDLANFARHNGVFTIDCPPTPHGTPTPDHLNRLIVGSGSGCRDDMVSIPVSIQYPTTPIDEFVLKVSFDPNIVAFDHCVPGALNPGWDMFDCASEDGLITIAGFTVGDPIPSGQSGELVVLTFSVVCDDCNEMDSSLISVTQVQDDLAGFTGISGRIFYACSATPTPTPSQPPENCSDLNGHVYDSESGAPIAGATIRFPGEPAVESNTGGEFSFHHLFPGEYTITATQSGYHAASKSVCVGGHSGTNVAILMVPASGTDLEIPDISGKYFNTGQTAFYLNGVGMSETIDVTINWGSHTPGFVRWVTPIKSFEDPCTGSRVTRTFNMGTDFGAFGTLEVTAVSSSKYIESDPVTANFKVIPPPPGILPSNIHQVYGNTLKYSAPGLGVEPCRIEAGVAAGVVPEDMPLFGAESFTFLREIDFSTTVDGDGKAVGQSVTLQWPLNSKIAGFEFNPAVHAEVDWEFLTDQNTWAAGGNVHIGFQGTGSVPPHPIPFFFAGIPCYFRGTVSVGLDLGLDVAAWNDPADPVWSTGSVELDPFPYAEANLGVGVADMAAVEGYLGGGAKMALMFGDTIDLDDLDIFMAGGVRVVVLDFSYDFDMLEYTWNLHDGRWEYTAGKPVLRVLPRDYLGRNYAVFTANNPEYSFSRSDTTVEQPVQLNVFSQSEPDIAAMTDQMMMVWVYDDPERTTLNRTEIVYSVFDQSTGIWSEPTAVSDDGTADFHPQLAACANQNVLLAWENADDLKDVPDPGDSSFAQKGLRDTISSLEIAVSEYDSVSHAWSVQTVLTDNDYLDRSPRIATAENGTALITWVGNQSNNKFGSAAEPNDIHYALFDGENWSSPSDVARNVPSIIKSAMAYNSDQAIYLFIGDTDDDPDTVRDRELFAVEYSDGAWGSVMQLTNDSVRDADPQVRYDHSGTPIIVWYSDGNLESATDTGLTDRAVILDRGNSESSGASDFELCSDSSGKISLVWQDPGEDGVDMWTAGYDPVVDVWSKAQRLTSDADVECAMSAAFTHEGELMVIYDKQQTIYESRTVTVGGEQVVIDNIPVPGQTDLYLLRHTISGDLAVAENSVTFDPENLSPGCSTTIHADILNLGDMPATQLDIAAYYGAPENRGELIRTITLSDVLVGGDHAEVTFDWTVPDSSELENIYVIADPDFEQEDADRTNNTAIAVTTIKPDLVVSDVTAQQVGTNMMVTAKIANQGTVGTGTDFNLTFRKDSLQGDILTTLSVTNTILPGSFIEKSWQWTGPAADSIIYAIADDTDCIDEYREDNNSHFTIIRSINPTCLHTGDVDDDGFISAGDAQFTFRIALSMVEPTYAEECAANCNGDEFVSAGDAQQVFRAALAIGSCVD